MADTHRLIEDMRRNGPSSMAEYQASSVADLFEQHGIQDAADFGARLRAARAKLGWKIESIAAETRVCRETIWSFEKGRVRRVTPAFLRVFAWLQKHDVHD